MKFSLALGGLLSLVASVNAAPVPPVVTADSVEERTPGGIPSTSTAKTYLAALTVASQTDPGGYDRDLFPHWISSGGCTTRQTVLARDGTNVVVGSNCQPSSGSWLSPYDGAKWSAPADVDIDHMVPLKNAWISGANKWTTSQRQAFANDLTRPQLWAVTDNINSSKGDKSPDAWKPPLTSFYCTYAKSWVAVKYNYSLTISSAEKTALTSMLNTC